MKNTNNSRTKGGRNLVRMAILSVLASGTAQAEVMDSIVLGDNDNNFTMLNPAGGPVGGTNDVEVTWDGTLNTDVSTALVNMSISSPTPFFSVNWSAHDVKVFGEGSYTFEGCPGPIVNGIAADGSRCTSGVSAPLTMVVGEGQIGAHMLFDWNGNLNIDVINVWNVDQVWAYGPNDGTTNSLLTNLGSSCEGMPVASTECMDFYGTQWFLTSTDADGDGVPGARMIDGPFTGFQASFNIRPEVVPIPAAVWLMGSGLLGLMSVARRKRSTP